jgi:biotin carboxylase
VIAVDRDPAAPGFGYADRRAILSVDDEPALERLAEAERVDGVIAPGRDHSVGAAARIAARYGLSHPVTPESAVLSTSKLRQRERLLEAGIPQTRWKLVSGPDEELGFPCVVNAPDRQSRRGLSLVRSREQLGPAVQAALRASRSSLCLVEELVEGPEVTVNGFSVCGLFHTLTPTDRLESAAVWPSDHGDVAAALAARASWALGIEHGPTHTQLRITPDGPRVIGLSARLGGSQDTALCEAAIGVDLNGLALSAALGEEIRAERLEARPRVGHVVAVELDGSAGAVLGTGDSQAQALERAARAAECVRFRPVDAEAL